MKHGYIQSIHVIRSMKNLDMRDHEPRWLYRQRTPGYLMRLAILWSLAILLGAGLIWIVVK